MPPYISGPHDNDKVMIHDEIPSLGPMQIIIRFPSKPKSVVLQPEDTALPYTYENGRMMCTLPKLKIHEMIVIE
jgi:hypothetical protein